MATLFVSDVHLSPARPAMHQSFLAFLRDTAVHAAGLYILGDLFDYWAGDDELDDEFNSGIANALRALSTRGVPIHLLHGNRDFLLGAAFAAAADVKLISDPTLLRLHGVATLVAHGDALCTKDLAYQAFRAKVRAPRWQSEFLAQPMSARKATIDQLREENDGEKLGKTEVIMDVTPDAVDALLRDHGYPRLIHGHTHRPARHVHVVDGHRCERWVLGDWYRRGSYLRCDESGCAAVDL